MTAIAVVVFLSTKFLAGAWVVTLVIPLLMFLFWRTETYYARSPRSCSSAGRRGLPRRRKSVVIVPTTTVTLLTERALSAALSLGETVVAVAVAGDEDEREQIKHDWEPVEVRGAARGAARPPSLARPHAS